MQQNRAMDNSTLNGTTLSISALAFELSPFFFQSTHSTQIAPVAPDRSIKEIRPSIAKTRIKLKVSSINKDGFVNEK